LTDIIR